MRYWFSSRNGVIEIKRIIIITFSVDKLMLLGAIFGCLDPVLTIGAILSYRSPFVSIKEE